MIKRLVTAIAALSFLALSPMAVRAMRPPTTTGGGGVASGAVFSGGTSGSIVFLGGGGAWSQDNAAFFWQDTDDYLGIGINPPTVPLHVYKAGSNGPMLVLDTDAGPRTVGIDVFGAYFSSGQNGASLGTGTTSSPTEHLNLTGSAVRLASGIPLTSAGAGVTISTHVTFSANTVIDAYNASFGAVTAGSTSTVTWTEVTDRLGEFVTSSFTVLNAGYYEITAKGDVSQTAGTACLLVKVGGTLVTGGESCNQGVTALASIIPVSVNRILSLSAGNILRVDASATTANATFLRMSLTIKKVP